MLNEQNDLWKDLDGPDVSKIGNPDSKCKAKRSIDNVK
jgi:hypothetical protein